MDEIRKVFVLKQVNDGFSTSNGKVGGILRIEGSSEFYLHLSVINIKYCEKGEYSLFICNDTYNAVFFLGNKPSCFNNELEKEFFYNNSPLSFALIYNDENSLPVTVAFSKENENSLSIEQTENLYKKQSVNIKSDTVYDDEAVATENYYDLNENSNGFKEIIDDAKEPFSCDGNSQSQTAERESRQNVDLFQNEEFEKESDEQFFISAKREIEELFDKFPPYNDLKRFFPDSKWVRINYSSDKFYVVGIVKEKGEEKYICYGVPEKYSETPPKALEGYCTFIPLSLFDMKGDGFWMMFQDAITGRCVRKD